MTYRSFGRVLTTLVISASVVGCSDMRAQQRPGLAAHTTSVEQALGARDFERALLIAEQRVEARPNQAADRTLLGRAYLANGRFVSARTAFKDAMTLGARDVRTIVSLALIQTALGNAGDARALLSEHISELPAADYGLGMAIAGDANEGVRALLEAVRQPDADAKTRQNLAYALALAGNWGQARLVAGQDLDGSQVQQRLTQWAATAQDTALPQRVAALVGVAPRGDDAGMPVRLALAQGDALALAPAAPQPAETAAITAAQAFAPEADAVAPAAPMRAEAKPIVPFVPAPSTPSRQLAAKADAATVPAGTSDWVVQIGAYGNAAIAEAGWQKANARLPALRGYRKTTGTISLNGQVWHRLAVSGFDDRADASRLCATLNRQGQSCFVRRDAGLASELRLASRANPAQIAAR